MKPYSIVTAPYAVYIAPTGTAFPTIGATPAVAWKLLGENGTRSQDEDGVTITHEQTVNEIRAAGSTGPLKAARTEENMIIAFNLMDVTLEAYRYALNNATITTVAPGAGTPGTVAVGMSRGFNVAEYALLVRGPSPYDENLNMQFQVPRAYQSGNPAPQFTKGQAAVLALEFRALEDLGAATASTDRFGVLIAANLPGS